MKKPPYAFLFDIDGVVTHPETKVLQEKDIAVFISHQLSLKNPITLVTGRALDWVKERVLPTLKCYIKNIDDLELLYVSTEFGGSNLVFKDGLEHEFIDQNITLPPSLITDVYKAAKEYSTSHFIDTDKKTMVSVEMNDGMKVNEFKSLQLELAEKLKKIVGGHDIESNYEVHVDRIATNVRNVNANKHYAVKQVHEWLTNKQIEPQLYIAFGDSLSDLEMAFELNSLGLPFQFVFVGGKELIENEKINFPITITSQPCDKGVVEYISHFSTNFS